MNYVAGLVLFGALLGVAGPAEQPQQPVCNAHHQGQFWPQEANSNPEAARELYQRGELEMCSLIVWKYKWEHVSVNARDAAKGRRPLTSEFGKTGSEERR